MALGGGCERLRACQNSELFAGPNKYLSRTGVTQVAGTGSASDAAMDACSLL